MRPLAVKLLHWWLTLCIPMEYSLLESEWTPGVGDRQGGLACCDSWGRKELYTTERLNWTELNWTDVKNWLTKKVMLFPDAGKDWRQEDKGTTEDEMVGWHHWLDGHGSEWTLGVGDRQGGLTCCDSWGCRVGHNWATELTDCWFTILHSFQMYTVVSQEFLYIILHLSYVKYWLYSLCYTIYPCSLFILSLVVCIC